MAIKHWKPSKKLTRQEKYLLKRCLKKRKLFAFLRQHRHEIFDEEFRQELEAMYRDTGAGKAPLCPELMAMALILQGYHGVSDAEAVELTVVDLRWQMVLDRLGETEPAFSQGALFDFRERLIEHEMDRRLLETVVHTFAGGPVGLSTIAAVLGEEDDTVEDLLEPFLIQQGLIQRTRRGRAATPRAYEILGVEPPQPGQHRLL